MASLEQANQRTRLLEIRLAGPRDRLLALCILLVVCFAAFILAQWHPSALRFIPPCPTKALLGLECPGCGSTRAVHHLLNLRFSESWRLNPAFIVLGLPTLALLAIDVGGTLFSRRRVTFAPRGRFGVSLAVILTAYLLARNLP